jgi:hypothetical protein
MRESSRKLITGQVFRTTGVSYEKEMAKSVQEDRNILKLRKVHCVQAVANLLLAGSHVFGAR